MDKNDVDKLESLANKAGIRVTGDLSAFLNNLKDFARTVGEPCPEGHRLDPGSGACLPMGSTDHTEFTRSVNDDQGPEWRGEVDKEDTTFASTEIAVDADEMDEPESCGEGTTFSFLQRKCVSVEDAELENNDEEAAAPGMGGHPEITQMQPEGRRDTVNHDCPPGDFFDFVLRTCIPLDPKKKESRMPGDTTRASTENKEVDSLFTSLSTLDAPEFGLPEENLYALDTPEKISLAIQNFNDIKNTLTASQQTTLQHNLVVAAANYNILLSFDSSENNLDSRNYCTSSELVQEVFSKEIEKIETAASITTEQRQLLPDSGFGVPGKRKFPLDSCGRVRNAMSRFNQSKGLNSEEKATLRRKILARARACGIAIQNFGKATTEEDFIEVLRDLLREQKTLSRLDEYSADHPGGHRGPCPPGMVWDPKMKKCGKTAGFVGQVIAADGHSDIVAKQPEGRRDTVGFNCPPGSFFDFQMRRCTPLDPSMKTGTSTTKANQEDAQSKVLAPSPAGKPARLPSDCPANTIWDKDEQKCIPLDSRKKTKSEDENAAGHPLPPFIQKMKDKKKGKDGDKKKKKGFVPFGKKSKSDEEDAFGHPQKNTTPNGDGGKKGPGCPEGQFMNPVTKKCMPRKGAFKGKSEQEIADNREGLVDAPAGKVRHPDDCPAGTAWDGVLHVCKELDSMKKVSPGNQQINPKMHAVDEMSIAKLIQHLDRILQESNDKEKSRILAKSLPNAAFPPSVVSPTKRVLMHHTPEVEDPYDTATVDVSRLRNALARADGITDFSDKAVEDAKSHLLFHAKEIVKENLTKKG